MRFLFLLLSVSAIAVTLSAAAGVEKRAATHEEWEEMVQREVERLRVSRSLPDEAAIVDMHEHYRKAFKGINDEVAIEEEYGSRRHGEMTRERKIDGRYIVFLQADANDRDLNKVLHALRKAKTDSNGYFVASHMEDFRHIGKGFTATLSPSVVKILEKHPLMYNVESDRVIKRSSSYDFDDSLADVLAETNADDTATVSETQTSSRPEWNLDRIDQRDRNLNGVYKPRGDGASVDVYILDTGIRYSHHEFGGRAKYVGYDSIDRLIKSRTPMRGADCNGHGTHCAATIGGRNFGVAKAANLYSARVLDCSGTGAVKGILDAMEFILKKRAQAGNTKTAVFSMSLGVKRIENFNSAVDIAVKKGIVVASASGNQMGDSCQYSPGSASLSLSVAASNSQDNSASFSNIGSCTDIYAPGYGIISADSNCDSCTASKSGTSMACPHVAGYAAILLGLNPSLSPAQVKSIMVRDSTKGKITMNAMSATLASVTPNRLLYVGK